MTTTPLTTTPPDRAEPHPAVPATAAEIRLARRPHGPAVAADFSTVTVDVPRPGPGELLVRNLVFSVDPYMRGRMSDAPSYAASWELDRAMLGGAIGEVVALGPAGEGAGSGSAGSGGAGSGGEGFGGVGVGTLVEHGLGWREYALVPADQASVLDPGDQPLSRYLGALGMTGLTAWVGLFDIAAMQPGDTVFVSGAAGAVGSLVGQLARARGAARVIGSAGGPAKVAHLLDDLHYDAAFDYRAGDVTGQLAAAAPDGIDVYFDNVGGDHLEAALAALRTHGRIAMCGSISGYNATESTPGPRNTSLIVGKRMRVEGFIVSDHLAARPEFRRQVADLISSGGVVAQETVSRGLDSAIDAFLGLFTGANTGKAVIALADTSSTGAAVTA